MVLLVLHGAGWRTPATRVSASAGSGTQLAEPCTRVPTGRARLERRDELRRPGPGPGLGGQDVVERDRCSCHAVMLTQHSRDRVDDVEEADPAAEERGHALFVAVSYTHLRAHETD